MFFSNKSSIPVKHFGIRDGIKLLSDVGFPRVDLSMSDHTEEIKNDTWKDLAIEYKHAAEENGIKYNQAHAPFGGGPLYVAEKAPLMPKALEFAATAGVETLVIHPLYFYDLDGNEHKEDITFERNMEFFSSLTPIARDLGVKIAIENLWTTNKQTKKIVGLVCADPESHKKYVTSLGANDVFTACLDVGHTAITGGQPQDSIRALGKDILGALHIHDVNYVADLHTRPYLSRLDWDEICKALGEIDYTGVMTFEADAFLRGMPREIIPDAIRFMASVGKHLADKVDSYRNNS